MLTQIAPGDVRDQVIHYWHSLGLVDHKLVQTMTDECIAQARKRVGRDAPDELLRRSLEEAQRRLDHALGRALGLAPSRDPQPLTAARAAFLLTKDGAAADALFRDVESATEFCRPLRGILPRATPPEAHLNMPQTPLDFWLFRSTHR